MATLSPSQDLVEDLLVGFLANELDLRPEAVDRDLSLGAYGLSSMTALKLLGRLEDEVGLRLPAVLLFEHPTIRRLALAITLRLEAAGIPNP